MFKSFLFISRLMVFGKYHIILKKFIGQNKIKQNLPDVINQCRKSSLLNKVALNKNLIHFTNSLFLRDPNKTRGNYLIKGNPIPPKETQHSGKPRSFPLSFSTGLWFRFFCVFFF